MKITVKKKQVKEVPFKDIPVGTVYKIGMGGTLLKLGMEEAVILKFSSGKDWLEIAGKGGGNWNGRPATEILGKITEIIVEN